MSAEEAPQSLAEAVEALPPEISNDGMSFEDAMQAALDAQAEEIGMEPQIPEEMQEPQEAPEQPEEVEAAPEPVAEETPVEEPPSEPEKAPSKSLARIMEREQKLMEREQQLKDAQPELERLRDQVQGFERAQANIRQNPAQFIRSLLPDADLKRIAEDLWYESQGDAAPQAYLQKKAANQHNSELAERIAKIEQGDQERQRQAQQQAAQQAVAQYQGSLESYVKTAGEEIPLVKAMQERNPQWVSDSMFGIAQAHARATNGQVLTPEQVAQALEKNIAAFQVGNQPKEVSEPPKEERQGASLRNKSTQIQSDREEEDELSDDYLRRKAFEAAGRPDLAY